MPFDGPVIPFGAIVEYHPISAKDLPRLHQFGPQVLPGIFLYNVLCLNSTHISPVPVSELVDDRSGKPEEIQANKIPKPNKQETTIERGDPLCSDDSEIPEWLQEFKENLVDDEFHYMEALTPVLLMDYL